MSCNVKAEPKWGEVSLHIRGWCAQCGVSEHEWDEEDDHVGKLREWQLYLIAVIVTQVE